MTKYYVQSRREFYLYNNSQEEKAYPNMTLDFSTETIFHLVITKLWITKLNITLQTLRKHLICYTMDNSKDCTLVYK